MSSILYCRISRMNDKTNKYLSLESQENALIKFSDANDFKIFKIIKDIGSAFSTKQIDLKNVLKHTKNKIIICYEPSRLTRNIYNYKEICSICKSNNHKLAFVSLNKIFCIKNTQDYEDLFNFIYFAQEESKSIGIRISRTLKYKKSKQLPWNKIKDIDGNIIDDPKKQKILKLIHLLSTENSSISEIKYLIDETSYNKNYIEPFSIVEYDNQNNTVDVDTFLPFSMSKKNIVETLNLYNIPREVNNRICKWNITSLNHCLSLFDMKNNDKKEENMQLDDIDNILSFEINKINVKEDKKWIYLWYDPEVGLPPNIILPKNFILPIIPTNIYLPQ